MIGLKESLLGSEDEIYSGLGDILHIKKLMEPVVTGTDHQKLFRACDELPNYFMSNCGAKQVFRRVPADKLKDGIYIIKTPPRLHKSPDMNDLEIVYLKGDKCQYISVKSTYYPRVDWYRYTGEYSRLTFSTLTGSKTNHLIYYCRQSEAIDSIWDELFKKAHKHTGIITVI